MPRPDLLLAASLCASSILRQAGMLQSVILTDKATTLSEQQPACCSTCSEILQYSPDRVVYVQAQQLGRNLQAVEGCAGMAAKLLSPEQSAAICRQAEAMGLPGLYSGLYALQASMTASCITCWTMARMAMSACTSNVPAICMQMAVSDTLPSGCRPQVLLCRSGPRRRSWRHGH